MAKFEGIVLYKRPHKDKDALVKIYTKEAGKKMFFVRSGSLSKHPLTSQLQIVSHNNYVGTLNDRGLSFIQEASTINFYKNIRLDILKQAHAVYWLQLVDACIEDGEVVEELYTLILQALDRLEASDMEAGLLTAYIELYLLKYFGVGLNFKACSICGEIIEPFDFSVKYNGLICTKHFDYDIRRLRINPRSMHFAYVLANTKLEQLGKLTVSNTTLQGLSRLTKHIYDEYVGLRLKSKSYLDQLEAFENSLKDE